MAAKIILSMDGVSIKEYPLQKERMTIGRKTSNDIVIDNLAVSGEHAAIITILHDSFLEDLDSTNGLIVNGMATKKHFLQNNDLVEIGKHSLKYVNDQVTKTSAADFEKTMVLRGPIKITPPPAPVAEPATGFTQTQVILNKPATPPLEQTDKLDAPVATIQVAVVQILTGPNAGKELELVKNLTTLGKPGLQVAVLARRPHGFFITHVEGASFPLLNGQPLNEQPHQLKDHDLIDLAGVKMEFYFKA
jgi:pSer/pThr/pTyr-binding forkhead associated (FHA) protein